MELINFLFSIILILFSLWLIWFFIKSIFSSLGILKGESFDALKGAKKKPAIKPLSKAQAKKLEEVEDLIDEKNAGAALSKLKGAFILDKKISANHQLVSLHNRKALSALLRFSDLQKSKIENLSILEQLLTELEEFDEEYINTEKSFKSIQNKRTKSGKALPAWGKKEFKEKLKETKASRENTLKCFTQQLDKALSQLKEKGKGSSGESSSENEVTYH